MKLFAFTIFVLATCAAVACASTPNANGLTICRNLPASGTCNVNLALLSCDVLDDAGTPTGTTEVCVSDNANICPDQQPVVNCVNHCANGDFAAACGGPPASDGGAPSSDPPSPNCKLISALPSGTALYCCPCGA